MRSTMRRAGEHMVTVRPRFDLNGQLITAMVARQLWDEASNFDEADEPAPVSRRQVEEAVTRYLQVYGQSELDDWATYLSSDEDVQERAWAWAREQVLRVWPELTVPAALP